MTTMSQAFTLLNPGPINVSAAVRDALATSPDQCHREPEYLDMQGRVREKLALAFGVKDAYEAILVTGSGTAAMEAMVTSVVGTGLLVIDNGVYGSRLASMAEVHRIPVRRLSTSWFERPDPTVMEHALDGCLDTIAVVHHETTTGLLNDLRAVSQIAQRRQCRLIVDSVSGLGGEYFDFREITPDAVCSTANKCIQGLPGVSFVLVRKGLSFERRSVYLDLGTLLYKQQSGDTPFTPAIQVTAALEAALDELIVETVPGRIARYRRAATALRAAIEGLGLELLLPAELRSNTITCAQLPNHVSYEQIHASMRSQGYIIYAGPGDLGHKAFRVANMGLIPSSRIEAFGPALARAIA